ncbi:lysophospholipid acyltransferase family protein [Niveibacterium sp. SC-1]|uniref:lysophospholipid acyltransferase family protein n=1 Tax=Niveibacterium sp. SC-1 TaxID=3135646 RepID=UPI00311DAB82
MPTFFRLLGRLPLCVLHALGFMLGLLVWSVSGRYRRVLGDNLAQALGRSASLGERMAAAGEAGKGGLETAWVWSRRPEALRDAVRVGPDWAAVEAARAAGRGIVFFTPHLGCFEISAQYYAATQGPITVLFRRPRKAVLAPLMDLGRNRGAMRAVPADASGVRQLLKALKAGEAIGILPDQVPQAGEGLWAPFFGKPAYTMTLAARLAGMNGSAVFLAFARRRSFGRGFILEVRPLELPEGSAAERVAALNRALEALILSCPAQYLWGYKRYKRPAGVPAPEESLS